MRILVIDDQLHHQISARQTLVGHDLTVVGTYDEAYELLAERHAPYRAVRDELDRRGFKDPNAKDTTPQECEARANEAKKLQRELCPPPSFDVVLCDLLMPASAMTMGPKGEKFVGQEMPVGFALSLMAVIHGAKYVAVVTDTNHHDHPASAMLDTFVSQCGRDVDETPPRFMMNGAVVGYYHSPLVLVEGVVCPKCNGALNNDVCYCTKDGVVSPKADCKNCKGTGRLCWTCGNSGKRWGKDWLSVLSHLIAQPK